MGSETKYLRFSKVSFQVVQFESTQLLRDYGIADDRCLEDIRTRDGDNE